MITKFKLFEKALIFTDNGKIRFHISDDGVTLSTSLDISELSDKYKKIYDSLKFKIGEPVRIKNLVKDGINFIFYIDGATLGNEINHKHKYHIKDDKYIYQGMYYQYELMKLSEEEKMALKYNI